MTPEQWQQARRLFEEVSDLPPDQQARRLAATDLDPALRGRVSAMLEAERGGRIAERLVDQAPGLARQIAHVDRSTQTIGPYTIGALLGRGGMGEIYRAHRSDGAYEQDVAVKFVTLPTPELAARFERERQLLASLEHPGIARLLDGGLTDDGTPYLVMEYIDGEAIDDYCDRSRFDLEQRLRLFLMVLDAVSAAHRQLIVHRDIKPGNILVTEQGQTKLIDFGIGKSLAAGLGEAATLTHQRMMTPSYAAPEQLTGGSIGTHTDSFQLGLLLDELICGVPGRRLEDASIEQAVSRCLAEVEPARQRFLAAGNRGEIARRRRTGPDRLARRLSGDLDLILKKACAIDPRLRYRNVDDMADDIGAYLAHRPVRARKPSRRYLVGKFVQRHRVAVLASLVAFAALIGSLAVSVFQTLEAERQRGIALLEGARHQQVKEFLLNIFHNADPAVAQRPDVSARELIARASEQLDESAMDPLTAASIYQAIGQAYLGLGMPETATAHLRHALELFDGAGQADQRDYADASFLLGESLQTGTYAEALTFHEQALELRRRLLGDDHPDVATSLLAVARALRSTQDHERIIATFFEALDAIERYAGRESPDYARALIRMGNYYGSRGELEAAYPLALEAYGIASRTLDARDPDLGRAALLLGTLGSDTGRFDVGSRHLRQALEIFESVYGRNHPRSLSTLGNLSVLHGHQGDFDALLSRSTDYRDRLIDMFGPDSPKAAYGWSHLGVALYTAERFEKALEAHDRAIAIIASGQGEIDSNGANQMSRGRTLLRLGRSEEALQSIDRALTAAMGPRNRAMALISRAEALLDLERPEPAREDAERALALAGSLKDPLLTGEIHIVLARIHRALGDLSRARGHLRSARGLLDDSPFHAAEALRRQSDKALRELASS